MQLVGICFIFLLGLGYSGTLTYLGIILGFFKGKKWVAMKFKCLVVGRFLQFAINYLAELINEV